MKLSDDTNTPGQVEYFFKNYFLIDNFSQLRSLSVVRIKPLNQSLLLSQLPFLTNLVSLRIESICGNNISDFDLPQLKKLIFSSCANTNWLKVKKKTNMIELLIIILYYFFRIFLELKLLNIQ